MADHEPPLSPPLHPPPPPPPPPAPPRAAVATVARHMATVKKSRKKTYLTPDEALDRLLAEHERTKAKAAKKAIVTQDRDTIFAIGDQEAPEEVETQPPAPVKKSKAPKTIPVVTSAKTKKSTAGASGSQRRKKYAT